MIRNKMRVFTFTTIIQHSSGSPSYSNQRRKRNERNQDQKKEAKLSLFVDDMILYTENYKTLMKEIKDDKEMDRYPMFLGKKNQYCENDYTTKCNL